MKRVCLLLLCLLIASVPVAICGLLFDYSLDIYFGKDVPWYVDCLAGAFTSPVTLPAAVVGCVLVHCDVATPILCPE